jgi:translin
VSGPSREDADLLARTDVIRVRVAARHAAREQGIQDAREAVRNAANAIRAVHRGEGDRADSLIAVAKAALDRAVAGLAAEPDLLHAGFVQDGAKEVAEAVLTRAAVAGERLPGPDAVGVDDTAWLHGLAETVGELRRACLDHVRAGRLVDGEALLDQMQEILSVLVTIDAPDGVTRGLRRSTDAARAITERTRGDLTTAVGQQALRDALDAHREAMERMTAGD